jgi:hypothetical protein
MENKEKEKMVGEGEKRQENEIEEKPGEERN